MTIFSDPAAAIAPVDRPWKAPSKVRISIRSGWPASSQCLRAILIASSAASVPELVKNTVSAKVASTSIVGQPLLLRDPVEVRDMPQPARLFGQIATSAGMGMPQRVHRDPRAKVEVSLPVLGQKPRSLPRDKGKRGAVIGRQNRRDHRENPCSARDTGVPKARVRVNEGIEGRITAGCGTVAMATTGTAGAWTRLRPDAEASASGRQAGRVGVDHRVDLAERMPPVQPDERPPPCAKAARLVSRRVRARMPGSIRPSGRHACGNHTQTGDRHVLDGRAR